ncbi:hypothetical protein PV396_35535 [Streptomyces sp. ME02-8801-2C]|uniref:hypothetical protein n=1 Tax=Streptomyces sp. ME02-8801-2C TaxID=3028680 RepID=UPI0029B6BE4F|nr:hypothetical protein [Streptomyces sp. ME02-8801-2C]MDX3457210.1 hypothetical protein [Streptomyces sp. ME02-8801-2C]
MGGLIDNLDRLDLDAHERRWLALGAGPVDGAASQWMAAARTFTARIQQDLAAITDEQWRKNAEAWANLMAAAERSTGPQHNEWLLRDLWLRSWLLEKMGPREHGQLFDPGLVIERALDAMPMSPEQAAELASQWRELERSHMFSLRMIRRLLNPVRHLAPLLVDHLRWSEFETWERLAGDLP